jgi:nitrate/nitrite transporter NarK
MPDVRGKGAARRCDAVKPIFRACDRCGTWNRHGHRTEAGIAFVNSVGNLGGFIGPCAMGYSKDATGSFGGGLLLDSVALIFGAAVVIAVTFTRTSSELRGDGCIR